MKKKDINELEFKINFIFDNVRLSERDKLDKLPVETSIHVQTGYLLGYADCWNRLKHKIKECLDETKMV